MSERKEVHVTSPPGYVAPACPAGSHFSFHNPVRPVRAWCLEIFNSGCSGRKQAGLVFWCGCMPSGELLRHAAPAPRRAAE